MTIHLGPWEKILVMAVGASVVMITLILVVCFVGPGCWGYMCLHREEEELRRRRLQQRASLNEVKNGDLTLGDVGHYKSWKKDSQISVGSTGSLIGRMSHRDSTYSSMSEATDTRSSLSMKSALNEDVEKEVALPVFSMPKQDGPSVLTMTLQFFPATEFDKPGQLYIGIKSVTNLPSRDYIGALEPYTDVEIVKVSWPLHRRAGAPLHHFRTRALRQSFNPHFEEIFQVDATKLEVKDWCLKVSVYDQDRFTNATELCGINIALKDVKLLTVNTQELLLTYNLIRSEKTVGELHFGLSYLPTSQRLAVSVIKATNLKFLQVTDCVTNFNPYVRVVQLNGANGRSVKRKKTTFRRGTENPEFNETFSFDLAARHLETATFLVMVCHRNDGNKPGDAGPATERRRRDDPCLGKVAVGSVVAGKAGQEHWLSVLQDPRKMISVWHSLK